MKFPQILKGRCFLFLVACLFFRCSFAESVDLLASRDTFIRDGIDASFGGDDEIPLGYLRSGNVSIAFLFWDLSQIPTEATIQSAEIELRLASYDSYKGTVYLNALSSSFSETTTTWFNKPTVGNRYAEWDRTPTGDISMILGGAGVVNWVSAVVKGVIPNQGIQLSTFSDLRDGNLILFRSSESANAGSRPRLKVSYSTAVDQISSSPDSLTQFSASGGSKSLFLNVQPESLNWTSSSPDWISLDKNTGSGDSTIQITAGPNNNAGARSGSLVFSAGTEILNLVVSQKGKSVNQVWGRYTVDDTFHVHAEDWLGWLQVKEAPWVWSYNEQMYLYIPEATANLGSGWIYAP